MCSMEAYDSGSWIIVITFDETGATEDEKEFNREDYPGDSASEILEAEGYSILGDWEPTTPIDSASDRESTTDSKPPLSVPVCAY